MQKNNEPIFALTFSTPLGNMTAFANPTTLMGLYFSDRLKISCLVQPTANTPTEALLHTTKQQIKAYFKQQRHTFNLPYHLNGTPFQCQVWQALGTLKWGQTITYGQLAATIKHPKACRAVGQSVSRNPFSIILPCHRVIGSNGSLTGFAAGIERKKALLLLES